MKIRNLVVALSIFSVNVRAEQVLARHELFWEHNDIWYSFDSWSQTYFQHSSKRLREHIIKQGYRKVLDVGCGVCPEFFGFKSDNHLVDYQGIDITPRLLTYAKAHNLPVQYGHAEKIPFDDNSFECVYARHLLEHLKYYKKVLPEMIRVAQKEVIVIFFLEPAEAPDGLDYKIQGKSALFNNHYNKAKLESFIRSNAKVKDITWELLNKSVPEGNEAILHIHLHEVQL